MIFEWMLILNIFKKNLTYPLEYLHVPPGVHVPPFENHCSQQWNWSALCWTHFMMTQFLIPRKLFFLYYVL